MSKPALVLTAAARSAAMHQLVKFSAVGVLNTLVGYAVFAALLWITASPLGSLAGATVLGMLFNFKSIGRLVFQNRDSRLLPRFLAVYAGQFAINAASLHGLVVTGFSPFIAQLVILPPLALATFVVMRRLVFDRDGE